MTDVAAALDRITRTQRQALLSAFTGLRDANATKDEPYAALWSELAWAVHEAARREAVSLKALEREVAPIRAVAVTFEDGPAQPLYGVLGYPDR
ncbi:hypothetical protein EV189_3669 [Motilibacter rhizosphaerae]|uniref:Uncharacterized protein n=1 Tax=Motilibacter rhizosphaerae TaxID=598652 RepID=A0A4Q7NC47_9ACTN|nr:hypothetical protein [Motilibacter rhizosphaerae]RZS80187.1 hypothetical protein EV189_3669 [Motilibacter rhizosphaerae]